MTSHGRAYELQTSGRRTSATGGSAWHGLPTPTTSDAHGHGRHGSGGPDLRTAISLLPTPDATHGRESTRTGPLLAGAVTLLPTPRASANEDRQYKPTPSQLAGKHGKSLQAELCALLPTPRASDTGTAGRRPGKGFRPPLSAVLLPTPRATDGTKGSPRQRGSRGDLTLPSAVLLPTPTATDSKSSSGSNPKWGHGATLTDAARSIGAATDPQSPDGPT
jgi:DNA (cytosine-5)-methyltransferase 1